MVNTLKQFVGNLPTNCLNVFDHFMNLALKGLNAFRGLKASWDEVNESTIRNCFKKCDFSQVESVTEEAQNDAEFQDLFYLLTTEVTADKYLSFDDDVETQEEEIYTTQADWRETTRERCIQEVTNDVVENPMELDHERSDQKLKEIEVVDNLKPVAVMHM